MQIPWALVAHEARFWSDWYILVVVCGFEGIARIVIVSSSGQL